MYLKIGNLQDRKKRYEAELELAKENVQEVEGESNLLFLSIFVH